MKQRGKNNWSPIHIVNMTVWGSCTLTQFDRQFLFFPGSLKNDYTHSCITYRLANIFYTTMTHNIIDLWSNSPSKAQLLFVHKQRSGMSHGKKCIKETSSDWPA